MQKILQIIHDVALPIRNSFILFRENVLNISNSSIKEHIEKSKILKPYHKDHLSFGKIYHKITISNSFKDVLKGKIRK